MSMVFHFLKKDLRRCAWLFSLWIFLFVFDGILALSTPPPEIDRAAFGDLSAVWSPIIFVVLRVLILAVLVMQLIQEDAVVGSTAFWLTRPMSRIALLLAKLAGLGLVVLIPLVVSVGVLFAFGISVRDLGWAVVEILIGQLYFVVPLALIAALTSGFARFVTATVTLAIGLVSTSIRLVPVAQSFTSIELDLTRYVVGAAIVTIGGVLLLINLYLTRRSRRSIVLALCLLGADILVSKVWSKSLVRAAPVRSLPPVFDVVKASVKIGASWLTNSPYIFPAGSEGKNLDGACVFSGIPSEFLVQIRSVTPHLSTPDGIEIATRGAVNTVPSSIPQAPAFSAISAAIGGIPVNSFNLSSANATNTTLATIDQATFLQYKDSPVELVDEIDLVVSRFELTAEIPVVAGSRYDSGSVHLRISSVAPIENGFAVVIAESAVDLKFGETVHASQEMTDPRRRGDPVYLLINREHQEAALVGIERQSVRTGSYGGFIVRQSIKFPFTREGDSRIPIINRQWLNGATLVRLDRVPVAEFSRTTEVRLPKLGETWTGEAGSTTPSRVTTEQTSAGTAISISQSGVISLDGKTVTEEELKALLVRTHAVDPDATVVIIADEKGDVKNTTRVMDACRMAGLHKFRLKSR